MSPAKGARRLLSADGGGACAGDPRQLRRRGRRPDAIELKPLLLEPLALVDQLDQVTLARGPERTGAPR